MRHDQITEGILVYYVPTHAHGDLHHKDVEAGIVVCVSTNWVMVRFFGTATTVKACKAEQLYTNRGTAAP